METPEGGAFADELLVYCGLRVLPSEVVYHGTLTAPEAREFDFTIIRGARKFRGEMLKRSVASAGSQATAELVTAIAVQRKYIEG